MDSQSLASTLRAWARGSYPTEAGTELLIRRGRAIYEGAPWITKHGDHAAIDPEPLLAHTAASSGGEQRLIRTAASLVSQGMRLEVSYLWMTSARPTFLGAR